MKTKLCLLSLIFSIFLTPVIGQTSKDKSTFKIIGYYPIQAALTADLDSIPFDKLTHINLWFHNPDSAGNFTQNYASLASFIEAAHTHQIKVLFSIGGGSKQAQYHTLLQKENRTAFIQNLLSETHKYQVDGIDVDLEGSDIDENYESFVVELAALLRSHKKLITAATAVYYKDQLTDKALAQFDFINIMSYDRTGPWRPEKPGPHATYDHAAEDLAYFGKVRSIPKKKMTLGVPFYGYGYGPLLTSKAISMNYREILTAFPGAEKADQWEMPEGKTIYYNGINTIRKKTLLAKKKASGIMIWQLPGDAAGQHSLLEAIHEVAYGKK